MGKSNKNCDKDTAKDGEVGRLKRHIHHLEKENKKLKSELKTYERVFSKNVTFLKEKTRGLSLEELITGANNELNLEAIKQEKVNTYEDLQKKWKCYSCEVGVMKLIIIPRSDSNAYFRKCSNPKCGHRTEAKEYTEEVDKGV